MFAGTSRQAMTGPWPIGCAADPDKPNDTAFLLAIDQFEELFTFADVEERGRFDRLLAGALEDPDCPLFVISTVRSDFLDRFAEDLPRLVAVRNRQGRPWTLVSVPDEFSLMCRLKIP